MASFSLPGLERGWGLFTRAALTTGEPGQGREGSPALTAARPQAVLLPKGTQLGRRHVLCGICTPSPLCQLGEKMALRPFNAPTSPIIPDPLSAQCRECLSYPVVWHSLAYFKWDMYGDTWHYEVFNQARMCQKAPASPQALPVVDRADVVVGQCHGISGGKTTTGLPQPPASLHPIPCQHPEQPQGLAARAEGTSLYCLPGASTPPVAPPGFTKQEKQVPERLLHGTPTAGTRFPCLVPPSLLRATSCSSSVPLILWGLFSIMLLC